jgi:hypothetical protein
MVRNPILEYELCPEQFVEVTAAIFNMDQGKSSTGILCAVHPDLTFMLCALVPSIIKSLFSWNWQSATLNCGDELVNLPLAFLQPYAIHIPDFNHSNGQSVGMSWGVFGVLSMFWDTKTANADVCIISEFWPSFSS